jgi:hypothetical protein
MPFVLPSWCPIPGISEQVNPGETIPRCKLPCVMTYFIVAQGFVTGEGDGTPGPQDLNIYALDGTTIIGHTTCTITHYGLGWEYSYGGPGAIVLNAFQTTIPIGDNSSGTGKTYLGFPINGGSAVFACGGVEQLVYEGYFALPSPSWSGGSIAA